jgi:nitrite reductase/ring-hydroxylating ferredoxin subunit
MVTSATAKLTLNYVRDINVSDVGIDFVRSNDAIHAAAADDPHFGLCGNKERRRRAVAFASGQFNAQPATPPKPFFGDFCFV